MVKSQDTKQQAWQQSKQLRDHVYSSMQEAERESKLELGRGYEFSKPASNDILFFSKATLPNPP